jgi:phage shock protein PspC (stress-responsive transcriptional regulator)
MNKTISINLGGRNFFIEEDAFQKLDAYLKAIKQRFSEYQGNEEIVADMESRIGEKFAEKSLNNSQAVITNNDVDSLIKELGSVEDIAGDEQTKNQEKRTYQGFTKKRLMRNGDDKIIAGVASGMAAYFGIDPIIIRLIFGLLLFAGGSIIPIYILLWIIMPEAKTPSEKMEMRGEPFNLDSINETIKERANEFKSHIKNVSEKEEWRNWKQSAKTTAESIAEDVGQAGKKGGDTFRNFLGEIGRGFGRGIRTVFNLIFWIIGFVISIGAVIAIAAVTFGLVGIIFNLNSPYIGLPVAALNKGPEFYVLLFAAYFIALIPLQLILLLGHSLRSKKNVLTSAAGFGLLGAWLLALIIAGTMGIKYIPQYVDQIKNSPEFQPVSRNYESVNFNKLDLSSSINYKLVQGSEFSVKASGRQQDIDRLSVNVVSGTLIITNSYRGPCVFCIMGKITLEITAPDFTSITAKNSSTVDSDSIIATTTTLTLLNSSTANINYQTENLVLDLQNSSNANLKGDSLYLKAHLENSSRLAAENLTVQNAELKMANSSYARVNVKQTLKYDSKNSSQIYYVGTPELEGGVVDDENEPQPIW